MDKMRENVREWIKAVLTAVVVAVIAIQFVVPTTVYGVSMEPTFENNDYLLISKQAYSYGRSPQRGDVIVFSSHLKDENGESKKLIKRVIAVPAENFHEIYQQWKNGKITGLAAAKACGMPMSTFRYRAEIYEKAKLL